jgi:magnesium transporter
VSVTWIDFWGIPAPGHLEQLGSRFGLHPLLLEDLLNTEQRPKIEDYGEILYVVLRAFHFDEDPEDLASEQLSIVIAADFLLSFQERTPDVFEPLRARLRSGKGISAARAPIISPTACSTPSSTIISRCSKCSANASRQSRTIF